MCTKYAVRGLTYLSFSVIRVCHVHTSIQFLGPYYLPRSPTHYQPGEDFLLSTVEQTGLINSFLKRAFKYGLCSQLFSFLDFAHDADQTLFNSMLKKQHCLQVILPEVKTSSLHLRQKGHMFDLPRCTLEIHKRSFLPWCLFKFI